MQKRIYNLSDIIIQLCFYEDKYQLSSEYFYLLHITGGDRAEYFTSHVSSFDRHVWVSVYGDFIRMRNKAMEDRIG